MKLNYVRTGEELADILKKSVQAVIFWELLLLLCQIVIINLAVFHMV